MVVRISCRLQSFILSRATLVRDRHSATILFLRGRQRPAPTPVIAAQAAPGTASAPHGIESGQRVRALCVSQRAASPCMGAGTARAHLCTGGCTREPRASKCRVSVAQVVCKGSALAAIRPEPVGTAGRRRRPSIMRAGAARGRPRPPAAPDRTAPTTIHGERERGRNSHLMNRVDGAVRCRVAWIRGAGRRLGHRRASRRLLEIVYFLTYTFVLCCR